MDKNFDLVKWKAKRRQTLCVYCFCGFIFGSDYTLVLVTLIPYLEQLVQTKSSQFYYGLYITSASIVASISAIVMGRIVDRTQKIKLALCISIGFSIMGNLTYTIYVSPFVPLLGFVFGGVGASALSMLMGEIIRMHDENEGTRAQWFFNAACSVGYMTGSWINLTFVDIELLYHPAVAEAAGFLNHSLYQNNLTTPRVNSITIINKHNFPGVLLAFLKLISLVVVLIFAYDCSKVYNLKQKLCEERERAALMNTDPLTYRRSILLETKEEEIQLNFCQYDHDSKKQSSSVEGVPGVRTSLAVLRRLLHTRETLLLLTSTGLFTYILSTLDLIFSITVLKVFVLEERVVSITYASYCAAYFATMVFMSKYCISNKRVYMLSILCVLCIIFCLCMHVCIRSIHLSGSNKLILLVTLQLMYLPTWMLEEVVHTNLLARVVQADVQCFAEAIRGGVARVSGIAASFLIAMEVDIKKSAGVMIAFATVWLFAFLFLRKRMSSLKIMV